MKTYFLICIISFLAGFTQGLSGFGSVLLALPLLALFLDIKTVIPLVALIAMILTTILLIQLRNFVEWKKVFPLLMGALIGIPVGVFFLKKLDKSIIQLIVGVTLILFSLYSLFIKAPGRTIGERWAPFFGFLGGCLGGAITATGPPVIVYTSLQQWSKDTIKATLQGFFFFSGILVVLSHAISGLTTATVIRFFIVSLPLLIVGTYTGSFFYGMVEEEGYKRIIFILLTLLGIFMVFKSSTVFPFSLIS
jgi:uncharacterized membrane protein YfcA